MNTLVKTFRLTVFGIVLGLAAGVAPMLAQVSVSIPNTGALPGAAITIPVNVGSITGLNVTSFEFEVVCDSTILRFTGIESSGTLSAGLGPVANYYVAPRGPGRMKVTCASATPIAGSGVLIYLKATAQTKIGSTVLDLTGYPFLFNAGTPSAVITNGSLRTNRAPTMTAISSKTVAEKDTLKFTATVTDLDLPNDTHTFSLIGAPIGASITSAGVFTWVPDYGQAGSYSFRVKVTDLGNASDSTTVSVTVTKTNRKPTFTTKMSDTTIADGVAYSFFYAATDPDAGTTLTYKLESGPSGATVSSGGLFSWTPSSSQVGIANIVVSVSDGALADTAKAKITVIHVNRKPTFVTKLRDTTINQGATLTFSYSATDPDAGTTITYSLVNAPSGASISGSGVLTFTPPANPSSAYVITARASDGSLADTVSATVFVNRKPVFVSRTPSSPTVISRNVATSFTVTASDPDGNPLTFTWKVNGATEKTGDNTFTRTFTDAHNTAKTVTAVFTDPGGLKDSTTWNFNITKVEGESEIPTEFALGQNYPNPFNPTTTLRFDIPEESTVVLEVYNVIGLRVRMLVPGVTMNAGKHQIMWDGRDDHNVAMPSGVYLYRIKAGEFQATKRMTLLK